MRLFRLVRHRDVTGVSGTGVVAEGVQWSDGSACIRWVSAWPSTTHHDKGVGSILAVHGHHGATTVEWL